MFPHPSSQPCPGLHVATLFCGNSLVICSSYSCSYLGLLHLVVAEMEKSPLYPSSAPVVKAVPEWLCLWCAYSPRSVLIMWIATIRHWDYNQMHVGQATCDQIHSGHNNYGKIYMVASDIVILFFSKNAICNTVTFTATKRSFSLR